MNGWRQVLKRLRNYPSAVGGMVMIAFLAGVSFYAVAAIPYGEALELWRGGEQWRYSARNASPRWINWFRSKKLPSTIVVGGDASRGVQERFPGGRRVRIPLDFKYDYDGFPSEINLFLEAAFASRRPLVCLLWQGPDGVETDLGAHRPGRSERISISQDPDLQRRFGAPAHIALLSDAGRLVPASDREVLPGHYRLVVDAILFGEESDLSAKLVSYGRVQGLAGTDHRRRDLMVALLWGTPVALAFGLLAAAGTTIATLVIAAAGVWFGGWVDAAIQRITEVNMILPLLPILVMVGALYSRSLWVMLAVVVALGIFSAGIKMYRSMLLPVKQAPFVEAARAYGAGNSRIILRYMIPRVLPVLIPSFVTLIPTFVFLEASLAVLGLGDPVLPTWGKILNDAQNEGALYNGYYYWVVSPTVMLMLGGFGFAMLGFALDRIFNPRLRKM